MINKTNYLLLIITTLAIAFAFQGSRGLFETTEGRYAEASREMLQTNDWLTPQLDYKPHWTKPPMIYWCIALSIKFLGVNTWGARICNSLFFCATIFLIFNLSKTISGREAAYLSWMISATAPFMIIGLQSLTIDMLLTFWELLIVLSYWKCMRVEDGRSKKIWLTVLWLSSGAAFLTKGPPGLLSLLCIILFNYLQKLRKRPFMQLFWTPAIVLFLLSGFLWYVIVIYKNPGLLHYYVSNEIAGRILTNQHHRNSLWIAPLYIYIIPLLTGLGPWVFLWFGKLKKDSIKSLGILKNHILSSNEILFLIIWCFFPLLILSLVKSRLVLYMLPFFPAFIMLTSLVTVQSQPKSIIRYKQVFIFSAIFILILKGSLAFIPSSKNMYQLYRSITDLKSNISKKYSVISTHSDFLYGLQFYLNGNFVRENYKNLFLRIEQSECSPLSKSGTLPILIIDNFEGDSLMHFLQKTKISFLYRAVGRKYSIYLIKPSCSAQKTSKSFVPSLSKASALRRANR